MAVKYSFHSIVVGKAALLSLAYVVRVVASPSILALKASR
jgi:hypothetical protein